MTVKQQIENIRNNLLDKAVFNAKVECKLKGIPDAHFSESSARRSLDTTQLTCEAIIEYLERNV